MGDYLILLSMGDLMIRVCTKALDGNDARAMMANGDILEKKTQENMWKHVETRVIMTKNT